MILASRTQSPLSRTVWSPDSWRQKVAAQQAEYPDPAELARVVAELRALPPLVHDREIEALKLGFARAAEGKLFVLQGGDCAESFSDCGSDAILAKLTALLQMSLILRRGTGLPVLCIGRMAGQYAKPRSQSTETRDGVTLPSYRGDIINRIDFTREGRAPDPTLLLRGYERAALTLNFIRTQREMDVYTSHEMLAFDYDVAQTRHVEGRGWYNLTTHFPWIGVRTNAPDGAHVEYCRGIRNPIGLKVGPETTAGCLSELLEILHPDNEPGRIVLIHRFGAGRVAHCLPSLIEAVRATGKTVLWLCDPMHGNTETTDAGVKTRCFDKVLAEVCESFRVHHELGSVLGGVHLELTGENVTECIGGAAHLTADDLGRDYRSKVDPRLNYAQSLEMASEIALQMNRVGRRASLASGKEHARTSAQWHAGYC